LGERFKPCRSGIWSLFRKVRHLRVLRHACAAYKDTPFELSVTEDPIEAPAALQGCPPAFELEPTPPLPLSTAPPALESRKRARKHTTAYREAFGDSQEESRAGIKRGKTGGLL
jgi:hypothetical protein